MELLLLGFPGVSDCKESTCKAGDPADMGSIPGSGRSPGEGNGNQLQYSCLENSRDREAWWATVSNKHVHTHTHTHTHTQSQSPLSTMDTTSSIHHFLANICQRERRKVKNFNTHQEYFLSN